MSLGDSAVFTDGGVTPVRTMKELVLTLAIHERINVTFRWINQHVCSCPLFKAGVACCLPTCAQGSSVPVMENAVSGVFWAFWFLLGALCICRVLVLLVSCCVQGLGYIGVPSAGHALWAEVGGGITLKTSGENA